MRCPFLAPVARRLFFIALILFQVPAVAQEGDPLAKAPNDSVRIQLLSQLSGTAPAGEWEGYTVQLKALAEKKLAEAKSAGLKRFYAKHLAIALNNLGLDASNKGNDKKAAEYWEQCQVVARQAGDLTLEATSLSNVCRQYYNNGQLEKAATGFHQALGIFRLIGDQSRIASSLNYLGDIYRAPGRRNPRPSRPGSR